MTAGRTVGTKASTSFSMFESPAFETFVTKSITSGTDSKTSLLSCLFSRILALQLSCLFVHYAPLTAD